MSLSDEIAVKEAELALAKSLRDEASERVKLCEIQIAEMENQIEQSLTRSLASSRSDLAKASSATGFLCVFTA